MALPRSRSLALLAAACALLWWLWRNRKTDVARRILAWTRRDPLAHVPVLAEFVSQDPDFVKTLFALSRRAKRQPLGIGRIRTFGPRDRKVVIVTRPEHVVKVLSSSTSHGLGVLRFATRSFIGKRSLFALEGEEWQIQRQIMRNILHKDKVQTAYAAAMESVTFRMVLRLAERINDGKPIVDVNAVFARMHVAIIAKAFFGDDFGFFRHELYPTELSAADSPTPKGGAHEELIGAFEYLLRELPRMALDANFRQLAAVNDFNKYDQNWEKFREKARVASRNAVRMRLENSESSRITDVLSELIEAQRQATQPVDENELVEAVTDSVVQLIFAGYNTVVVGLTFSLFYLAQNPVWWERVRAEADNAFASSKEELAFTKDSLPILDAVFKETLRLVPPTGFTARLLKSEVELEPTMTLPEGSDVFIPIVFLCQDQEIWGHDAAAFNPRRWLDRPPPPPGAFIPFSFGPRNCIGEFFAQKMSLTALAMLVHFFAFELVPGAKQMPKWTGFGIRPVESNFGVALNLKVSRRKPTRTYSMQRRKSAPKTT